MRSSYFFRVSWTIQLLVGISLFTVSFMIEKQVLEAFITTPIVALLLAASLELGKAVAIIWHRFMSDQPTTKYPASVRISSTLFRSGLVFLSMLCSLLFLSGNLDRPNLDDVRTKETAYQNSELENYLKRIEGQHKDKVASLKSTQEAEYQLQANHFNKRIDVIQKELTLEMDNVVNGTFKGPRYAEIEQRLNQEKTLRDSTLQQLATDNKQQFNEESKRFQSELENKQEVAYTEAKQARTNIRTNDFSDDERANDPRIVSFLKVVKSVAGAEFLPLQFVFAFSLLISLLMEIGILLAFNTVTLSIMPALKAMHAAGMSQDILQTEVEKAAREDEIRHEEAVNKIRRTADNVMDKAKEYMRANPAH